VNAPVPGWHNMNRDTVVLKCPCGEKLVAKACRHINAASQPKLEEQLLRGELNAAKCPKCGKINYLEEPLVYSDTSRRIMVLPRSWKGRAQHAPGISEKDRWTRTFYGLDALLSFIAAEGNAPREYGDRVADQAQMIADMYYAVGMSRCKCGDLLRVEREFIAHHPDRGSAAVVRARCVGCGEAKTFSFPIGRVRVEPHEEGAGVPIKIRA